MANATEITVNDLTANAWTDQATADALDTGTSDVTLYADVAGEGDRVIVEVTNTAAEDLDVTVLAGDDPPAFRSGMGALTAKTLSQNDVAIFGPFESARFIQNDGTVGMTFAPGGTIAASIRAYKLPKA